MIKIYTLYSIMMISEVEKIRGIAYTENVNDEAEVEIEIEESELIYGLHDDKRIVEFYLQDVKKVSDLID